MAPDRERALGSAFAAGAAMLFGTSYVATAIALRSFDVWSVAMWRGVGGALLLLPLVAVLAGRPVLPRTGGALLRLTALGILGGPTFLVAMNVAVAASGATIAAFVAGSYAVLAALFARPVLGEPLGRTALVGFALALTGTALLAELRFDAATLQGIAAGLVGAVSFALFLVLSRRWSPRDGLAGPVVALTTFVAASVVLVSPAVSAGGPLPRSPAEPEALLAVGWLVLAPSLLAQLLIVASVRRVDARLSSAFLLLNPPTAALGAAILLGERLTALQAMGAALILTGMALAVFGGWMAGRWVVARARVRLD